MGTSHSMQLDDIVYLIRLLKPESLLDVGIGFGKYGLLAREYLDLWEYKRDFGDWKTRIDGIEVFEDYITPVQEYIYDTIFRKDAMEAVPELDFHYDLALLIAVIEHFDKDDGKRLLRELLKKAKNVIISTPLWDLPQDDINGNIHERHLSSWRKRDIEEIAPAAWFPNTVSLLGVVGEDAHGLKGAFAKRKYAAMCPPLYRLYRRVFRR